MAAANGRLSQQ